MHFRVRKKVIQFIRSTYDPKKKGPKNTMVGNVRRANPVLSDELRSKLTIDEIVEFESWLENQHHVAQLRAELVALQLPETLSDAAQWFEQQGNTDAARAAAADIIANWQPLRHLFVKNGLLD